jgi:ubiquinone/menaquinone biosynthesis C-methylase UbiE
MMHPSHPAPGTPPGAGHSSFGLLDAARFLGELKLKGGDTFLDLGCGEGNYTLALADRIGPEGLIYALDLWEPGLEALQQKAAAAGYQNIRTLKVNIGQALPLGADSIDYALMATVLHDLVEFHLGDGALKEAARVLKPGGTLAIVEFKKVEGPPGPPLRIRLSPDEVAKVAAPFGFQKTGLAEVGPYNYLILFTKEITP